MKTEQSFEKIAKSSPEKGTVNVRKWSHKRKNKNSSYKGGKKMADKIYFTITGTGFFEGDEFFEKDMEVLLEKEPDNKYDHEAILVKMPGIGKVGHVANSCSTVIGESYSAGRIYDKIGNTAVGKVLYKMPRGILCELVKPVDEIKF